MTEFTTAAPPLNCTEPLICPGIRRRTSPGPWAARGQAARSRQEARRLTRRVRRIFYLPSPRPAVCLQCSPKRNRGEKFFFSSRLSFRLEGYPEASGLPLEPQREACTERGLEVDGGQEVRVDPAAAQRRELVHLGNALGVHEVEEVERAPEREPFGDLPGVVEVQVEGPDDAGLPQRSAAALRNFPGVEVGRVVEQPAGGRAALDAQVGADVEEVEQRGDVRVFLAV